MMAHFDPLEGRIERQRHHKRRPDRNKVNKLHMRQRFFMSVRRSFRTIGLSQVWRSLYSVVKPNACTCHHERGAQSLTFVVAAATKWYPGVPKRLQR